MNNRLHKLLNNPFYYIRRFLFYYTRRFFFNVIGYSFRWFFPIKKGKVMLWADAFSSYGCNPKAISDYILTSLYPYEVYWAFSNPSNFQGIDNRVKVVKYPSIKFIFHINTAEFLITNHRTYPRDIYWKKHGTQKYIMTWHGTMGIKRAEADMSRTKEQITLAKIDSANCDVMLSDSEWYDSIIKRQLEYSGKILRIGIPRNDIYYDEQRVADARRKVRQFYNINDNCKILLYAPTFRDDHSIDSLITQWEIYHKELNQFFGGEYVIMFRLHQVMKRALSGKNFELFASETINATEYYDMQDLLCAADLLVTDYSSTMFDMGLLNKPCILYATDVAYYNRGFLFDIHDLPMPLASTPEEFKSLLSSFDESKYLKRIGDFYKHIFGVYPGGNACKKFLDWMQNTANK